jgi:protein gp37
MNKTSIEWTHYTWNPVTGCTKISAGCRSCYAETMATRFWGNRKFTDVQMHLDRLQEPFELGYKLDGKKVFVCDVSDLFHDKVMFDFIASVFSIIAAKPLTTFQILTKRPDRALEFYQWATKNVDKVKTELKKTMPFLDLTFPPKNIWIGTSVENQEQADKRIPLLLQIPASVRFLSCEPLIGEVDLTHIVKERKPGTLYTINCLDNQFYPHQKINWVIAGGESGHMARPMHPDWVRSLRDQCQAANVPFFFKQWGNFIPFTEFISRGNGSSKYFENNIAGKFKHVVIHDKAYFKLGKSKSGNLLDGKQHLEFPKI